MKYVFIIKTLFVMHILPSLQSNDLSHRQLSIDKAQKEKICLKADPNFTLDKEYESLTEYTKELEIEEPSEFILNIFLEGTFNGWMDFAISYILFVIMIALGAVTLLFWPALCGFWCGSCCMFNTNKKTSDCGLTDYLVSILCLAGLIGPSIAGFFIYDSFTQNLDNFSCALMTFFDHTYNGDGNEGLPKWIGLINLDETLETTAISLDLIHPLVADSDYFNVITTPLKSYTDSIDSIEKKKNDEFTDDSKEFLPYIYSIVTEKEFVVQSEIALKKINDISVKIEGDTKVKMKKTLTDVTSKVDGFAKFVDSISASFGETIVTLIDLISEYIILGFQVYYGVLIGVGGVTMIVSSIYVWGKLYCLKYVLHVMWNLIMFFTIISFLLGGVLGLVGSLGTEVIAIVNHLFNDTYLSEDKNIFGSKEAGNHLNICINGDGNLGKAIISSGSKNTELLDELYKSSVSIEKVNKEMDSLANPSETIEKAKTNLKLIKDTPLENDVSKLLISSQNLYQQIISKIKSNVSTGSNNSQKLIDALNPILGANGDFISLLNCKFMKSDIIMFLDIFGNQFSDACLYIGITLMCAASSNLIGIFFLISMIYDFTEKARNNDKEEGEEDCKEAQEGQDGQDNQNAQEGKEGQDAQSGQDSQNVQKNAKEKSYSDSVSTRPIKNKKKGKKGVSDPVTYDKIDYSSSKTKRKQKE